jgi:hypothetical protein
MATTVSLKPNAVEISGSTSGTTTLQATAVAGTTTLTLPAATDTLVGKATTDTLTNKTLTGAAMNGTLGATTPSTVAATTLTTSSTVTHNGGTANGVAYLNGSKVLTTGTALVFDGTNLGVGVTPTGTSKFEVYAGAGAFNAVAARFNAANAPIAFGIANANGFPYLGFNTIQVNGTDTQTYATSNFASRLDAGSGGFRFNIAASGTAGNAITFTQAMTLTAAGDLLVGATSTSFSEKFNATQSADQKAGLFFNTNASFTNNVLNLRASRNTTNSSYGFLQCSIDGVADKLYIYDSGNVVNTNNSYGALSDVKLKENIVDATPKLDDLLQVKVRNYNLIGDTQKQIGVVAQELETVFPGMIDESCDRDAEGNDLGTTTKSVKYSVFVPMLIKAMQEMKSVIDDQAARIAVLEAK